MSVKQLTPVQVFTYQENIIIKRIMVHYIGLNKKKLNIAVKFHSHVYNTGNNHEFSFMQKLVYFFLIGYTGF